MSKTMQTENLSVEIVFKYKISPFIYTAFFMSKAS